MAAVKLIVWRLQSYVGEIKGMRGHSTHGWVVEPFKSKNNEEKAKITITSKKIMHVKNQSQSEKCVFVRTLKPSSVLAGLY